MNLKLIHDSMTLVASLRFTYLYDLHKTQGSGKEESHQHQGPFSYWSSSNLPPSWHSYKGQQWKGDLANVCLKHLKHSNLVYVPGFLNSYHKVGATGERHYLLQGLVPPSVFSKVAHQWVHKHRRESVVFVMNIMKTKSKVQALTHLQIELGKTKEEADAIVDANNLDCCTGFVIGHDEGNAYILTCCHSMKQFYSAKAILTEKQIGWFNIKVLCIHQEEYLARTNHALYDNPKVDPRTYSKATVVKFSGKKDLMLLEVDMNHLYGDSAKTRCPRPHVPLKLAESIPPQLNDLIMISWPPYLCDTVVSGEVTNKSRIYNQVSSETNKGYRMGLIELNMIGREGCSGSPILNHKGEVFGLYHGRLHDKGYAVSFRDINSFLGPEIRERILS